MSKYGYARCSTKEDRQDIGRQEQELSARGAIQVFSEYISGAAAAKPELENLLSVIEGGDTLATTEVSRLSRSVHQLCHFEDIAREKKIKLELGSLTLDFASETEDPMSRAMYYMMGIFAELERGVTVERIKSGIANAKDKGVPMGRPRKTAKDVPAAVKKLLPAYLEGRFTQTEFAKRVGISRQSLHKYLRLLECKELPVVVPENVRLLYPRFKAGEFNKSEFAEIVGVARNTIKKYIAVLERDE